MATKALWICARSSPGAAFSSTFAKNFREVRLESYGHYIYWGEEGNEQVDFGCDRLREMAEEQAALLAREPIMSPHLVEQGRGSILDADKGDGSDAGGGNH